MSVVQFSSVHVVVSHLFFLTRAADSEVDPQSLLAFVHEFLGRFGREVHGEYLVLAEGTGRGGMGKAPGLAGGGVELEEAFGANPFRAACGAVQCGVPEEADGALLEIRGVVVDVLGDGRWVGLVAVGSGDV